MSETIQSISNGTYTLGDTNKLTFSAGPGIKIDEPSEGTVRIANDETVLWEDTTPVSGVNIPFVLNEPYTNFEKLRFVCALDNTRTAVELYTDNSQTFGVSYNAVRASNNAAWETWMAITFSTTTTASIVKTRTNKWTLNDTSTALNAVNKDWEYACRSLKKIIGINRISGSNA